MYFEVLSLTNFRCFGRTPTYLNEPRADRFHRGQRGRKTAVQHALQRLFGITVDQRRLRRQDFHIPAAEAAPPLSCTMSLEVVLAFPRV